jgi:MFS family permease
MVRQVLSISALLLGSAFLLFAGGINSLILPVRGSSEGFSALSLGLLGTGWAIGYVLGCLYCPRLVAKVGHIRAFSVMSALAALSLLGSLILMTPWSWIILRSICGFCFAGAAMIVESWLSERAEPSVRGRIFAVYTMVNLAASTAGQLMLTLGDPNGFFFFVLGAMFYILALIPTAISSTTTPRPLVSVKLDLRRLWRNSPIAVFGVFMVGISNSAFGTLAAVYADRIGLALTGVALFASLPIMAGAIAQIPVGILSDKVDRRWVLVGISVIAVIADLCFILVAPDSRVMNLALACLFGASIFAMYPVMIAHANDHASPDEYLQTSGGLLMVFGLGSIAGPLIAGAGMSNIGVSGLFLTTVGAHVLLVVFALFRITRRSAVASEAKAEFVVSPPTRSSTPETIALAQPEASEAKTDSETP